MKINSFTQLIRICWLMMVLGLVGCWQKTSSTNNNQIIPTWPVSQVVPTTEQLEPTMLSTPPEGEITICLQNEPETLYIMDSAKYEERLILATIYDQSINNLNNPIPSSLLAEIPTFDNRTLTLNPISVETGDVIFDPIGKSIVNYNGPEIVMNQTIITFTLTLAAKWADGMPVTPDDSVFAFNIMADPNTPSEKGLVQLTAQYEAVNPHQIRWTGIPNYFPSDYVKHFISPLPQHVWLNLSPQELLTSPISTEYPLGWGPFMITGWQKGQELTLEPNPFFYSQVRSRKINFRFNSIEIIFPALLTDRGNPNVCDLVILHSINTPNILNEYLQFIESYTYPFTWLRADFMMENTDSTPTIVSESAIRQAISYALFSSPEFLSPHSWGGTAFELTNGLFDPVAGMSTKYHFDPIIGRNMLQESGWVDKDNDGFLEKDGHSLLIRIGIVGDIGGVGNSLATIGINKQEFKLTVEQVSTPSDYYDTLMEQGLTGLDLLIYENPINTLYDCDQFISPVSAENFGAVETGGVFFLRNLSFLTKYSHSRYDEACRQASQTMDSAIRNTFLSLAQSILINEVPVIPLAVNNTVAFSRLGFFGFQPTNETIETWNIAEWYYSED